MKAKEGEGRRGEERWKRYRNAMKVGLLWRVCLYLGVVGERMNEGVGESEARDTSGSLEKLPHDNLCYWDTCQVST